MIRRIHWSGVATPKDCFLSLIPWFHAFGYITHLVMLFLHRKYVFMVKFEETGFLSAIEKYKVSRTWIPFILESQRPLSQ